MNIDSDKLVWLALVLIFGIVVVKFVYWKIGQSMEEMQRLAEDPVARREKLQQLDGYLELNPTDTEARLRRADLWRREGDFLKAASDLRVYLEQKPDDAEGWAELAECAILLHDKHEALAAAAKAQALDPAYADYWAIGLRAHLLAGNLDAAETEWKRWDEIDRARCLKDMPRSGGWLIPAAQRMPAEIVRDPALTVYEAELLLRRGERERARDCLAALREENPDYLDLVLRQDPLLKDLATL